jgi:hypothetical protein
VLTGLQVAARDVTTSHWWGSLAYQWQQGTWPHLTGQWVAARDMTTSHWPMSGSKGHDHISLAYEWQHWMWPHLTGHAASVHESSYLIFSLSAWNISLAYPHFCVPI